MSFRPFRGTPRPIGLPSLQLPDQHLNTTAFICTEELRLGGAVNVPRSTAFFVSDRDGEPPHPIWVVTARHCIQEARNSGVPMFLRVNRTADYIDIPMSADDWHEDDEHDVAVAYWAAQDSGAVITSIPLDQFVASDYRYYGAKDFDHPELREKGQTIRVGHEVFFVGSTLAGRGISRSRDLEWWRAFPMRRSLSAGPMDQSTKSAVTSWKRDHGVDTAGRLSSGITPCPKWCSLIRPPTPRIKSIEKRAESPRRLGGGPESQSRTKAGS